LQFAVGAITPFFWLSYMIWRGTTGKALVVGVTVCALLVLFSVFMMRWNVVIGGQEISKTGKGLLSYNLPLLGKEGALVAIALTLAPLALLFGLTRLFPPWEDEAKLTEAIGH
jgi:predicted membrane protein